MPLIPHLPLMGAWKERFQDVNKLNAYAKTQPVELSNVKIEGKNIDGAILSGGEFKNNDWTQVSVKKAHLTNVVFRQGILEDVDFSDSTLTDVVFEDMKLLGVTFFYTTLNNVRFVRCTFNGVGMEKTKNSRIEVIDSKAISSSFSDGQLVAVFRNSKLTKGSSETSQGVRLTDLQPPSSLTFEKSELDDVDLSRSVLNELVLDNVRSNNSGFVTGSVQVVRITGDDISFGFSETEIGKLIIHDMNTVGLAFDDAKITSITANNCRGMRSWNLYRAQVDVLDINNCVLNNFRPRLATIGTFRVKNGIIMNSKFEKMKAKSLILENVALEGELDFTGAQVGELKTTNITKQPGLNLITTGSNVKF